MNCQRNPDWTRIDAFMKEGILPSIRKGGLNQAHLCPTFLSTEDRERKGDPWCLLTRFIVLIFVPIANHLCGFIPLKKKKGWDLIQEVYPLLLKTQVRKQFYSLHQGSQLVYNLVFSQLDELIQFNQLLHLASQLVLVGKVVKQASSIEIEEKILLRVSDRKTFSEASLRKETAGEFLACLRVGCKQGNPLIEDCFLSTPH